MMVDEVESNLWALVVLPFEIFLGAALVFKVVGARLSWKP